MTNTKKTAGYLTCSRCKGAGALAAFSHVVYAGVSGGCYKCAAKGVVPNRAQKLLDVLDVAVAEVESRAAELASTIAANEEGIARLVTKGKTEKALSGRRRRYAAYEDKARAALALWEAKLEAAREKVGS